MAGESQRLHGGQETNMPCRAHKWKFIERRGKRRKETEAEICLPHQKNSGKRAGLGRTCLLKEPFAPMYRLHSDMAAIGPWAS